MKVAIALCTLCVSCSSLAAVNPAEKRLIDIENQLDALIPALLSSQEPVQQFKKESSTLNSEPIPVDEVKAVVVQPIEKQPVATITTSQQQQSQPAKVLENKQEEKPAIVNFEDSASNAQKLILISFREDGYMSAELERVLKDTFDWSLVWSRKKDVRIIKSVSVSVRDINELVFWLEQTAKLTVYINFKNKQLQVVE